MMWCGGLGMRKYAWVCATSLVAMFELLMLPLFFIGMQTCRCSLDVTSAVVLKLGRMPKAHSCDLGTVKLALRLVSCGS